MKKDDEDMMQGTNNVVKTVVFFIVAIVIVTSLAIPVLANVGTRTISEDRMNDVINNANPKDCLSDVKEDYENPTRIIFNANGISVATGSGTVAVTDGAYFDNNVIAVYYCYDIYDHAHKWGYVTYEYRESPGEYMFGHHYITEGVTDWLDAYYHGMDYGIGAGFEITLASEGTYFIQNPEGGYVRTSNPFYFLEGSENTLNAYTMDSAKNVVWVSDSVTKYLSGVNESYATSMSESITNYSPVDYEEGIDISAGATSNGVVIDYTIVPKEVKYEYTYTETTNILDGTIIQPLIGTIPLLLLIGIVLVIVKKSRMTDR